jgi:hypothetical protein
MLTFKLAFGIFFVCGAVFACHAIIGQIRQSFHQGYCRGRTGVAYRATSPKTFWFGMCGLAFLAAFIAAGACFLLIAPLLSN